MIGSPVQVRQFDDVLLDQADMVDGQTTGSSSGSTKNFSLAHLEVMPDEDMNAKIEQCHQKESGLAVGGHAEHFTLCPHD